MWWNLVERSLNDVLRDEDTEPVSPSDPRNMLYALITPDSIRKSSLDLLAHVPEKNKLSPDKDTSRFP